MMEVGVYRLPMAGPEDVSELEKRIAGLFINAIIGLIGDTIFLTSAGFEHQGPLGANLVAAILKSRDE